jgi:hypothetical protein
MIKVGICVAYDWEFLKNSIPRIYERADVICLGLDKDRHSWKCNPFSFDNEAFYCYIKDIDKDNKIDIYEDDFSINSLNTRENCNRHRMMIANRMGEGGWHIQLDSDEYFINFEKFVNDLIKINSNPTGKEFPINVCCPFIPLFKKVEKGFLYVNFESFLPENIPMATNKPNYERARQNGYFNLLTNNYVIHDTWARSEEEMKFKMENWGHASEELVDKAIRNSYFKLWQAMEEYNYQYIRNFHPAAPHVWPSLSYIEALSTEELINKLPIPEFPLKGLKLKLRNSLNYSRISKVLPFLKIK